MQDKLKSLFAGLLLLLPALLAGQKEAACSPPPPDVTAAIRSHPAMTGYKLSEICLDTLGIDTLREGATVTFIVKTRLRVIRRKEPLLWSGRDSVLMEPIRISRKKCPALDLNKKGKAKKGKDKCTCLTFDLKAPGQSKDTAQNHYLLRGRGLAGDSLVIDLKTVDGKPLKAAALTDKEGKIIQANLKAASVRYTALLKGSAERFTLYLRGGSLFRKQFATVKAGLHSPADTVYWSAGDLGAGPSDNPATASARQLIFKKEQVLVPTGDTILLQVTDITLSLTGKRNPMQSGVGVVEVNIPEHAEDNDLFLFITYWVGIGAPTVAAYAALEASTPPEWSQPGVTPPLAAFGLGRPIVLPAVSRIDPGFDPNLVPYVIADDRNRERFLKSGKPSGATELFGHKNNPNNFGKGFPGTGSRNFYFAFINQHDINTFPVQVKVVAYYQRRKPQERLVRQP